MPIFPSDLDLGFNSLRNALLDNGPIPPTSRMRLGYFRLDTAGRPAYFDGTALKPFIDISAFVDLSRPQTIAGAKTFTATLTAPVVVVDFVHTSSIRRPPTTGGANVAGASLFLQSGAGTGGGAGSKIHFQTPDTASIETDVQLASTKMVLQGNGDLGIGTTTPGARLQVTGGVAIAPTATVASNPGAGNLAVLGLTDSTSTTTGALVVAGGAAIAKSLTVGGSTTIGGALNVSATVSAANLSATNSLTGSSVIANILRGSGISGTNASGTQLTIEPGRGTGTGFPSSIHFNTPNVTTSGTTNQTQSVKLLIHGNGNVGLGTGSSAIQAKFQVSGGVAIAPTTAVASDPGAGNLAVLGTTASTSPTTGALTVAGGAAIAKDLNCGGAINAKGASFGTRLVTTNYTLLFDDFAIAFNASATNLTITLPDATIKNYYYRLKKIDASVNTVTIAAVNGQTIDGQSTFVLDTQYEAIDLHVINSNWWVY